MTNTSHNPVPLTPEREAELRQQLADQIITSYRDLRFVADQFADDLLPIVRAAVAAERNRAEKAEARVRQLRALNGPALQREARQQRERAESAEARERELETELAALKKRLHDAAMTKTWTNEDGKTYVFVEDLAPALLGSGPVTSTRHSYTAACRHPGPHDGFTCAEVDAGQPYFHIRWEEERACTCEPSIPYYEGPSTPAEDCHVHGSPDVIGTSTRSNRDAS